MCVNKIVYKILFLIIFFLNQYLFENVENPINLCANITDLQYTVYTRYTNSDITNCGCEEQRCVRKCCQEGFFHYHYENITTGNFKSICVKNTSRTNSFSAPVYEGTKKMGNVTAPFKIGMLQCNNKYFQYFKLDTSDPFHKFYVQNDGTLYYLFFNKSYSNDRYCIDEKNGLSAYLCVEEKPDEEAIERKIHFAAKILPAPFLLATFLIYLILPNPTNHSKALMCHVITIMFGFICLGVVQFTFIHGVLCPILGHLVVFFFSSAFLWMNVMCIDIWLAFSGLKGYSRTGNKESVLYIYFSIYAWGLSILHILIIFLLNTYMSKDSKYYPGIGLKTCFIIESTWPIFLYFFGPILILILFNIVFFVLTVINIHKLKKGAVVLNTQDSNRHAEQNNKIRLYWKLLFAMGLNPMVNTHIIQLISWASGTERGKNIIIWYIKDFSHAMYGPIIFLIFVCNKKTWNILKERINKLRGHLSTSDSTITMQSAISNHTPEVQGTYMKTEM